MASILHYCRELPIATFASGEELLVAGGTDNVLYVLIDGEVEIVKGDFQINTVSEPGAIFGEVAVLLGVPHMATVRALTQVHAYLVEEAGAFLRGQADITHHVARLLARRLRGVTDYLVDLKRQFEDRDDHLGMVDEVLESIVHQQDEKFSPGSERHPDTAI